MLGQGVWTLVCHMSSVLSCTVLVNYNLVTALFTRDDLSFSLGFFFFFFVFSLVFDLLAGGRRSERGCAFFCR